jgi:hypothetical protein
MTSVSRLTAVGQIDNRDAEISRFIRQNEVTAFACRLLICFPTEDTPALTE